MYTMSCEYLTGNIVVKLFYDWDFPCPHLAALTPNMTQPAFDHIQFELDQTQLEQLNLFLAAMQKAHPDVQIPDLALAARSGWKVKRKSSGWFVSLRCFVQGKCMYIEDIRRHIDNVFGENECPQLDRSVYKKTEQCLALVGGHKEAGDKRVLVPLTHTDKLEAFVVQDISGCELISPAPPATPAAAIASGITVPQKRKTTIRDEEYRPSPSASGSAQTASPTHLLNWIHGTFDVEPSLVQLDKIKSLGNSNYSIPTSSRQCPFAKREHNSNHIYFTVCYNSERGTVTVQLKCHDSDCAQRSNMVTVNSSSPVMQDALTRLGAVQSTSDTTTEEPEQQVAVTTDMRNQAVRQSLAGIQKKHPRMDCSVVDDSDLLQPTTLANGGFMTLLRNNLYCPLHKTMHDNWMNCVFFTEATQQLMCRQDVTQTLSLPVEKSQINVIFNINVTQTDSANETRDFGAFDTFPQLFENRDIDYLCYKSLSGTTMSFAKFAAEMIEGKYIFQDKKWMKFEGRKWIEYPGPDDFIANELVEIYRGLQTTYISEKQIRWSNAQISDLSNLSKRKQFTEELEKHVICQLQGERIPLDGKDHIIGFQNGVFDAKECGFREHRPDDYLTVLLPYALPEREDPIIRTDIHRTLESIIPSHEVREYLLLLLALHLEGFNKHAIGMIWTGSGGNGKGVLKDLMRVTFGGLHSEPPATFLTSERPSPEKPAPHLVDLRIKRSVFTSEPEAGKRANSAFIKFITGGDPVSCRACHSNEIVEYVPRFLVTLLCNMIPLFQGGEDEIRALWRRLKIFHFPTEFVDELEPGKNNQQLKDPYIREKLAGWGPEFMLMLIEIYSTYVKNGRKLTKAPREVEKNLEEQKLENNPLQAFMQSCLVSCPGNTIHTHHLASEYQKYLLREDREAKGPTGTTAVTKRLTAMGYTIPEKPRSKRDCCGNPGRELFDWAYRV